VLSSFPHVTKGVPKIGDNNKVICRVVFIFIPTRNKRSYIFQGFKPYPQQADICTEQYCIYVTWYRVRPSLISIFFKIDTVALSFLFDKYCPIIE